MKRTPRTTSKQIKLIPGEFDDLDIAVSRKRLTDEELFGQQCRSAGLPLATPQLYFAQAIGRKWRFDWAFCEYRLAVEIDGVVVRRIGGQLVVMGGHASIEGIRANQEKGNTAIELGWQVLHFLQSDVSRKVAIEKTIRVLARKGWIRGTNTGG